LSKRIISSINKLLSKHPDPVLESEISAESVEAVEPEQGPGDTPDQDAESDFEKLYLPQELLRAIDDLGFRECTKIQKEVLPHSLDGKDIIGKAQTGTGKTAAFLITSITYHIENPEIEPRSNGTPFALVVAPTRELALQITSDAEDLTKYCDFNVLALVGGIDYEKQKNRCNEQVDLIVATPGRLLDFCRSGTVNLGKVEQLIIDEADRMLSMGFIPDIKSIINKTPHKDKRQTLLFSATYNEDVLRLSHQWTRDPVQIEIEPQQVAVDSVEQLVYLTEADKKYALLYNLIEQQNLQRIIVFVNRRDQTRVLEDKLFRNGISSGLLTGEVPQKKRMKTLDDFKNGRIRVLVATDVAGRGIHVDDVSHVINYNLPEDSEDYVHRIGRTGRAGAEGISISFACETDSFQLPSIEALLGSRFKCELPDESLLKDPPPPMRQGRPKQSNPQTRRRR
jgi:ATP-dependent RNA helicase RhlB